MGRNKKMEFTLSKITVEFVCSQCGKQEAEVSVGDNVIYNPGYKKESGYVTSIQKDENISVFVCCDGTGRGQLTPYEHLS